MKVGIVAGKFVGSITESFSKRENIEMEFCVDSMAKEKLKIKQRIIELETFLFIVTGDLDYLMDELAALSELHSRKEFFKIKSHTFLVKEGDNEAITTIEYIMSQLDMDNYKIFEDNNYILSNVYSYLIGKTKVENIRDNVYKNIYIKRKGDEDKFKKIHEEMSDRDLNFRSVNDEELREYKKRKKIIYSTLGEKHLNDIRNKVLVSEGTVAKNIEKEQGDRSEKSGIKIITGIKSSGKTTATIGLQTSTYHLGKESVIIDLQQEASTTIAAKSLDVEINLLEIEKIVGKGLGAIDKYFEELRPGFNLISFKGAKDKDVNRKLLSYICKVSEGVIKYIDYPLDSVRSYYNIFKESDSIILTTTKRNTDVSTLEEKFSEILQIQGLEIPDKRNILFVNKVYNEFSDSYSLDMEKLAERFTDFNVTSEITFNGLNIEGRLASNILGGNEDA